MLLSKDKTRLCTRAGRGIDRHSPISTLVINVGRASLLKSLLENRQALWIDTASYPKYEASLPAKFKTSFLHKNFFLMPLQVNNKPVGMIFCDRAQAVTELDKPSYVKFKSAIMLTSKAFSYLVKRAR